MTAPGWVPRTTERETEGCQGTREGEKTRGQRTELTIMAWHPSRAPAHLFVRDLPVVGHQHRSPVCISIYDSPPCKVVFTTHQKELLACR